MRMVIKETYVASRAYETKALFIMISQPNQRHSYISRTLISGSEFTIGIIRRPALVQQLSVGEDHMP